LENNKKANKIHSTAIVALCHCHHHHCQTSILCHHTHSKPEERGKWCFWSLARKEPRPYRSRSSRCTGKEKAGYDDHHHHLQRTTTLKK
jgi:hypothetical protein